MPHDFRNKSFQKVLRGYAPDEVDDYIAYMNEEYRKLERRTADSERKLALALKKLDESAKNGPADSVGPAAREAAAKLLRETEAKRSEILAAAEQQANETAEHIVRDAETQAAALNAEATAQAETVNAEAAAQAEAMIAAAVQQAEAILAEAKAEADAHRDDVKNAQNTARSIYDEIGSFREKLFALYNEHLDLLDGVTESAQEFIDGVDAQVPAELPEPENEPEEEEEAGELTETEALFADDADEDALEENLPEPEEELTEEELPEADAAEELPDDAEPVPEEPETGAENAEEYEEDGWAEETGEPDEPESHPLGDEVASNLAFMDRLFAVLQNPDDLPENDLYIDIPEEDDGNDPEETAVSGDDGMDDMFEPFEPLEDIDLEADLPAITIDWKNRSAVSASETEEESLPAEENEIVSEDEDGLFAEDDAVFAEDGTFTDEGEFTDEETYADDGTYTGEITEEDDFVPVDESMDFRSADGFDEYGEEYTDEDLSGCEEDFEENYDEYSPDGMTEETAAEESPEEEEFEETEEKDEFHDMDQIFNEDKSKREMSLTDEFNIIFAESKSNQNVKEISRQPIVTPENPKNAKKHKKF